MECQNTIKNLELNKTKSIGTVVIIVEGEQEEFKLLKHIFTTILNYGYRYIKRNGVIHDEYTSPDKKNVVIVANTSNSNIDSVINDEEYKNKLKKLLWEDYHKNLKNTPVYIVWDRDKYYEDDEIYKKKYKEAINTFYSAYDNEYEMNGLLILSYPCVESYIISNFKRKSYEDFFISSKQCKHKLNEMKLDLSDITKKSLLLAAENMHRGMQEFGIMEYDPSNLKTVNTNIFRKEEEIYKDNKTIKALSLLSILLIDLQIIIEKENND